MILRLANTLQDVILIAFKRPDVSSSVTRVQLWRSSAVAPVYPGLLAEKREDEGELAKYDARQLGGYFSSDANASEESLKWVWKLRKEPESMRRTFCSPGCEILCDVSGV